jgi:hypothetical protein
MLERTRQELLISLMKNKTIIVWAVNDICNSLLSDSRLLDGVVLIDSDPKKVDYFEDKIVKTPKMGFEEILKADEIIICTRQWSQEILNFILSEFNKEFKPKNIKILDYQFD